MTHISGFPLSSLRGAKGRTPERGGNLAFSTQPAEKMKPQRKQDFLVIPAETGIHCSTKGKEKNFVQPWITPITRISLFLATERRGNFDFSIRVIRTYMCNS
jgi:hypothetical protein